jgi:hypothetical protein
VLLASFGCAGESGSNDATGVEARLCQRIETCDLLAEDQDDMECRALLADCMTDLDVDARARWSVAVEGCLEQQPCDAVERCYLQVPGC